MTELDLLKNIKFPRFIQFETNNNCNAKCAFCCYRKMEREHAVMPWSQILRIIDEVVWNVDSICPFLIQEPLLEHRLIPILRNIKQQNHKVKTEIYSNMACMTPSRAIGILKSKVLDEIHVSFYAPTKEIYELFQPPMNYDVTSGNIRNFMRLRDLMGLKKPRVLSHYILMPPFAEHYKDFYEEWKGVFDDVGAVHFDNWHGDLPDLENEDYWEEEPETVRFPCSRIWNSMVILSNGEVVPCCIDYEMLEPMGNIEDDNLHGIWNNERFQELREKHVKREFEDIELCKNCTVWRYQHSKEWNDFWLKMDK